MTNESENSVAGEMLPAPVGDGESAHIGLGRYTPRVYDALRLVMGFVLLAAAGLKARQLMTTPVLGTGLMEARWFLIGVVEFELLFAVWLFSTLVPSASDTPRHYAGASPPHISTPSPQPSSETLAVCPSPAGRGCLTSSGAEDFWTWLASIALFSAFGCVALWKALGGEATCGGFGSLEVNPWFTTAMDWTFVTALIRFWPQSPRPRRFHPTFRPLRVGSVLVIWGVIGGPMGITMATSQPTTLSDAGSVVGEGNLVVLEPERWIGKRLPLLNYIDIGEQLAQGEWTVAFYRSGCPDCAALLRDYKRWAGGEDFASHVALVEVPPYGDSHEISDLPGPTFVSGRLGDAREWFVKTPLQVKLTDGIVSWQSEQDRDGLAVEEFKRDDGG